MKITTNQIFYNNTLENQQDTKKVLLTDHGEMTTAIKEGTLTIDGVTLELSQEVRDAIEAAKEQQSKDNETVSMMNMLMHNAKVAKEEGDAMKEAIDSQGRALEIARRISKGGRVPYQDEKALMEYSTELYQMAKQASIMAKEHKKYDTLIKDEKRNSEDVDTDQGKIDTRHQVQIEVSLGETPVVESVSAVAVSAE